jgi:beta-glucosidase
VTNNGTTVGAEVVQLYLEFPASAGEPPQQLKAFAKTPVLGRGPGFGQKITL